MRADDEFHAPSTVAACPRWSACISAECPSVPSSQRGRSCRRVGNAVVAEPVDINLLYRGDLVANTLGTSHDALPRMTLLGLDLRRRSARVNPSLVSAGSTTWK